MGKLIVAQIDGVIELHMLVQFKNVALKIIFFKLTNILSFQAHFLNLDHTWFLMISELIMNP